MARERRADRRTLAIPPLAALVAYVLAMKNGFALDDFTLVVRNPFMDTPGGLRLLLTRGLFEAAAEPLRTDYYRPASSLLNWLSFRLFHDSHVGQHGLNVVMHMGLSVLLYGTLLRGNVRRTIALVAATLFAVHPANADVVAYVGGRQDMLGWLVVLGGAFALLRDPRPSLARAAAIGGVAMLLGTFSREAFLANAAVLPVLAAFDADGKLAPRRAGATAAGTAAGFVLVAIARSMVGVHWNQPGRAHSVGEWIEGAGGVLARMVKDLFLPTDLVVDLDVPKLGVPLSLVALVALVAILPLGLRALAGSSRRPLFVFGHLSLVATVAVHTPVAMRFGFISDRYAYPFVLGAALTLTPLAERAVDHLSKALAESPLRRILAIVPWLVAVALLPLTWSRVVTWKDEATLQKDMYEVRPDDPHSKFAEGMRRLQLGEWQTALDLCTAYHDRYPTSARPERCIGIALLKLKRPQEAVPHLAHYAEEHLASVEARVMVIDTMLKLGDLDGVERTLAEWGPDLAEEPDVVAAHQEVEKRRHPSAPPKP